VTLRAVTALPSLRGRAVFPSLRGALTAASHDGFRVLQFSVQTDHLHLLVEANSPTGFGAGVQGLAIRTAKAINRALGRHGCVWGDRHHARLLRTPREVRNALVYVLCNWFKHVPGARGLDPCSSAAWFRGWQVSTGDRAGPAPVVAAETWLASVGWQRHGLVGIDEQPRGAAGR